MIIAFTLFFLSVLCTNIAVHLQSLRLDELEQQIKKISIKGEK